MNYLEAMMTITLLKYQDFFDAIKAEIKGLTDNDISLIDIGHSDGNSNNSNSRVHFFKAGAVRCAFTGGDPIWEEADHALFSELAECCGVDL